jgi:inorganic pyrophosphatase
VRRLAEGCDRGDGDPLDICVISERPINHSEVLLRAVVVGGLKIIDRGEADDKIIAVLEGDYVWGNATELEELPPAFLERIEHYFSTYKLVANEPPKISITGRYGYAQAAAVIRASIEDYRENFTQAP